MTCTICGKPISRRNFIEGSARVGAAAVALGLPGGSAGAAEKPPLTLHCLCPTWCREGDVEKFEADTGIKTQRSCWTSHLATLTKLATGGTKVWDVIAQHHAFMFPMIRRKLLHPLDLSKIPNVNELFPRFVDMEHARMDGKTYGIPYVWTFDSVVYNADHIEQADSWGVLFDDKNAGKVALRDDPQNAIQLTALYLGHADPSVMSSDDIAEIKKFLISKKKNFRKFWTGYSEAVSLLRSGEVWALSGWRPMWWGLAKDGMNMRYAIPKEKAIGAINYYVVSRDTKALESAYAYLNWTLGTYWGAAVSRDQGYFATSKLALKGLEPEVRERLGYDNLDAVLKDVFFLEYPLNLSEWVQAWSEVKAA
jgi:spermidine/putrescine-binding protein